MNFDIIHLKFIEAPPIWLIMLLVITSIVFIAMLTYAIPILFRKKRIISTTIAIFSITILLINLIVGVPFLMQEYKNGGIYIAYIDKNPEHIKYIKKITKEEYNFIQNTKYNYSLSKKIKNEDINKIKNYFNDKENRKRIWM